MPNWCDNQVTISGPSSVIDKIEKIVTSEKAENGLLNYFYPMPAELKDTTADMKEDKKMIKKYGYSDWYGWATNEWGTKWEVSEFFGVEKQPDASIGHSTISFAFSSAWSPPIGAYENFLANNQDCTLRARYYEGGCDFMGVWEDYDDRCYQPSNYNSESKFFESGDGLELDNYFNLTEQMADREAEEEAEKEDVHEYVKGQPMNIGEEV